MWSVSVVQWSEGKRGQIRVTQYDTKVFRRRDRAFERYNDVVNGLSESGYSMEESDEYIACSNGFRSRTINGQSTMSHAIVFVYVAGRVDVGNDD